jgi:hypothetical protein
VDFTVYNRVLIGFGAVYGIIADVVATKFS